MAALPNADRLIIDRRKITDYLLSPAHPTGRGKARFFATLGFTSADATSFDTALRALVNVAEAAAAQDTDYGTKYIVDGELRGPSGAATVRTIWISERGSEVPRFVTAYPAE
jgi:hypothetical protein